MFWRELGMLGTPVEAMWLPLRLGLQQCPDDVLCCLSMAVNAEKEER
jgi:hypothetical protein